MIDAEIVAREFGIRFDVLCLAIQRRLREGNPCQNIEDIRTLAQSPERVRVLAATEKLNLGKSNEAKWGNYVADYKTP